MSTAIARAADRIARAASTRRPTAPVRSLIGDGDIESAYAVQRDLIRRRVAAGAIVVGRKIGLTATAVQRQLGVDQPDFGVLLSDMDVSGCDVVPFERLLQPKVEAELAFVLGTSLDGDVIDEDSVAAAVNYAVPALEIVDSRIRNWDLTIADTIADNASSGMFVLGDRRLTLDDFDPRAITMRMYADGALVSKGDGTACLGSPLTALTWLARTAAAFGDPLRAGQIILSGALGPMVRASSGTQIWAEIAPLGAISATFSSEEKL